MPDLQFAQTLAQHRSLMLRRAKAIVRNVSDAEDAVQDALERAWRFRERFTPGALAAPWLLKITQNAAISVLRRQSNAHIVERSEIAQVPGPDSDLLLYDVRERIAQAVRALSPRHRAAFILHDVHGLSHHEISANLGLPYNTVRMHLHRARVQIRGALLQGEC